MFFGNSRVVVGNNFSDPAVGGWLAVSPNPDEYSVAGLTYGFDDDVCAIEKMGSLFFFSGKFVVAYDGNSNINCWRVGYFDGLNYSSITYSGNATQGLTHTTSSYITNNLVAGYTMKPVLDQFGDVSHLLVGGLFNRVGHKTVHSMTKIISGPYFGDTVPVDTSSTPASLVRSISSPFTDIQVNPNNNPFSISYPADSYNVICGNGLTDSGNPAGGKILLYKFDSSAESVITDIGGFHPFSDIQGTTGTTGINAQFQGCFVENDLSDQNKVKIHLNTRQSTSNIGSHFQIYNIYDQTWDYYELSSGFASSCLSNPWIDPNATQALRGKKSVNNNFIFFKDQVHRIRRANTVHDEDQNNFLGSLSANLTTCGTGALPTKSLIALNKVYYNQADQLIVAGGFPSKIVLWDGKIAKDMQFPAATDDNGDTYITTIFVDTDKTIYVGGKFEFTDANGAIAKNIAKYVPSSTKLG